MDPSPGLRDLLRSAVDAGLITADQESSLLRLAEEREGGVRSGEVARGFNWVTVAYALGALLVVFACVWFLAERWRALGPWGVLVVSGIYAGVLWGAARWLSRNGFREAAGITAIPAATGLPVRGSIFPTDFVPQIGALVASRDALYELLANLVRVAST